MQLPGSNERRGEPVTPGPGIPIWQRLSITTICSFIPIVCSNLHESRATHRRRRRSLLHLTAVLPLHLTTALPLHPTTATESEGKKFMAPMLFPMKEKFDKYWADYDVFLSCAAVLDPRCKLGFVSYFYGKLYALDEAEHRVDGVKKTLVNLFAEYSGGVVSETPSDGGTDSR
ncbi:zinc finger BED domain-containing protein DAYSLEEPER-like [Hordeum vulgare]|nr:zinc finger BED domain-containing protein DAYSLEEPER-like [Hordeum vulgare]